ncbi:MULTISPECIES: flagellin [Cobetia]|uniref:flagellin N-terminal helical domain-containing protein n=1 Tax=Cobetia TaxID=204286 RepID=UPI0015838D35|nr:MULTISPECIES: flagellin [Cobetia]MDI4661062.1 flagellin FliC [Cobetia sp. BMC6]NUJ55619.1 flagellin FliC [Cobetia marina]
MASVINTNTLSMVTQQNLNQSQNALNTSMERLSSGLRINSAKDDAAGQAIANRMDSQITGLSQAQRNANDGISVAQTAEGALNQVNDNLQRVRELTVQAQNGTNNADDLTSIQNEIDLRLEEITRISEQTSFNGIDVLQEDNTMSIQVGANDGEVITIDLKQINTETLGLTGFNVDGNGIKNNTATETDLMAAGFAESTSIAGQYTDADFNAAATISDVFGEITEDGAKITQVGGSGTVYTYASDSESFSYDATVADIGGAGTATQLTPSAGDTNAITISLGGEEQEVLVDDSGNLTDANSGNKLYFDGANNLSETNSGSDTQASISDITTYLSQGNTNTLAGADNYIKSGNTTYAASANDDEFSATNLTTSKAQLEKDINADAASSYNIDLDDDVATTGDNFSITNANAVTGGIAGAGNALFTSGFDSSKFAGTAGETIYANDNGKITDGAGNEIYAKEDGSLTLESTSDATATKDPLAALDDALKQVDGMRSDLGAVQNRFDSAITNLATTETNLASAQSRIQDADYAEEVSSMTTAQILQQAGTSMLTQANQVPQNVLSLLG